ncbi:MAG: hypothetical protein KGL95_05780, partial [Patescibacteria group bacterium]|nr:hypothetical protein [Patescibacteria group bacterium]
PARLFLYNDILTLMLDEKLTMQNNLESMLYKGVEHIMMINQNGRAESLVSKNKIAISKERQEIFFMGFRLQQSLLQEFDDEFGPVEHFVIFRKNSKMISVPFGSRNLIFVMDKKFDHECVIRKTKTMRNTNFGMTEPKPLCAEVLIDG